MVRNKSTIHLLLKRASRDVSTKEYENAKRLGTTLAYSFKTDFGEALMQREKSFTRNTTPRHKSSHRMGLQKMKRKRTLALAVVLLLMIGSTATLADPVIRSHIHDVFIRIFQSHIIIAHNASSTAETPEIISLKNVPADYRLHSVDNSLPDFYTETYLDIQGNTLSWNILGRKSQGHLYVTENGSEPKCITINNMQFYCMTDGISHSVYYEEKNAVYLLQGVLEEEQLINMMIETL